MRDCNSNNWWGTEGYDATSIELKTALMLGIVNTIYLIIKNNGKDYSCQKWQRHELTEHTGVHRNWQLGNMTMTVMLYTSAAFVV